MEYEVYLYSCLKLEPRSDFSARRFFSAVANQLARGWHPRGIRVQSMTKAMHFLWSKITAPALIATASILLTFFVFLDSTHALGPKASKDHDNRRLSKLEHSQFHINRATQFYKQKNYSAAVRDFTVAIRLAPNHSILYYNRGNSYFRLKSYKAAIDDYSEAVRRSPQFVMAWANLGNAFSASEQLDDALNSLNAAEEIDANNPYVLFNRGFVYGKRKEYRSAIRDFTRLLRSDPEDVNALALRASAYLAIGETEKAEEDLEKARILDPSNSRFQ